MEAGLERALHFYRQGAAEFADCMHTGLCGAEGKGTLLTFDQKDGRLPGVQLLD